MDERPFEVRLVPAHHLLFVSGTVDLPDTEHLRRAIRDASCDYTHDVTVDLSDVDFFPSCAVGVLVGTIKALSASGCSLDIASTKESIAQRVLTVCGIPHRAA